MASISRKYHLGFLVDLKNGIFTVPKPRIDKLKDLLKQLHSKTGTAARFLAPVVGTIISVGLGIGPVSRMWTRLYANINQTSVWDKPLTLAPDALKELEFWGNCFEKFNGQPIWTADPICSVTSYSDSSEYGWGGYTVTISGLSAEVIIRWVRPEWILHGMHLKVLSMFCAHL